MPHEHRDGGFNPYMDNGGTIVGIVFLIIFLAIGGKGIVVVACDTRLSKGYSIISRESTKIA